MKSIKEHSGNKYIRRIYSCIEDGSHVDVDVYAVLEAFNVTCPAIQHALKKLLCTGIRGKADKLQDLKESVDAMYRAIQIEGLRNLEKATVLCDDIFAQPKDESNITSKEQNIIYPYRAARYVSNMRDGYVVQRQGESSTFFVTDVEKSLDDVKKEAIDYVKTMNEKLGIVPRYKVMQDCYLFKVMDSDRTVESFKFLNTDAGWDDVRKRAQDYADELNVGLDEEEER